MQKLTKQLYSTLKGEKKINCYKVNIPRKIVEKTNITENDILKISAKDNKITIEKEN